MSSRKWKRYWNPSWHLWSHQDYTIIGGVDAVVDILNTVDRGTEKHIMESLEIEEPELADEIRKKMFVFEDILTSGRPCHPACAA